MALVRDGDWTLFSYDMKMRRQVWVRRNPDGTQTFRTDYEIDPTIEANTAARNMASPGWAGDYHRVASIPVGIFHEQLAEASRQDDKRFISDWLNDADHSKFRTKEGRV